MLLEPSWTICVVIAMPAGMIRSGDSSILLVMRRCGAQSNPNQAKRIRHGPQVSRSALVLLGGHLKS